MIVFESAVFLCSVGYLGYLGCMTAHKTYRTFRARGKLKTGLSCGSGVDGEDETWAMRRDFI
jgi:hypothetical protein